MKIRKRVDVTLDRQAQHPILMLGQQRRHRSPTSSRLGSSTGSHGSKFVSVESGMGYCPTCSALCSGPRTPRACRPVRHLPRAPPRCMRERCGYLDVAEKALWRNAAELAGWGSRHQTRSCRSRRGGRRRSRRCVASARCATTLLVRCRALLEATAPWYAVLVPSHARTLLIVDPPSIRDFMVFEDHVVNARLGSGTRGVAARWYEVPSFTSTRPASLHGRQCRSRRKVSSGSTSGSADGVPGRA